MEGSAWASGSGVALMEPFVKMAGGKRQLQAEICSRLPKQINRYYEPFVGGGAIFFALAVQGRFKRATISDVNADLIDTYKVAAQPTDCRELIRRLRDLPWSEDAYYKIRDWHPESPIARAARFLYLNKCGFNGLHRVNARGECNVPFGHHDSSPLTESFFRRITAAGELLAKATITLGDYKRVTARRGPGEGDAIYCDPPYLPVAKTSFAAYDRTGFGIEETRQLAEHARRWADNGAHVLLSNADTPEVREIFRDFRIERVSARRSINSNGSGRGQVGELLISPFGQAR